jgi:hypothetical protein
VCAGTCNGVAVGACTYPTVQCRSASCNSGTQTAAANCDGAGSCPAAVTASCTPYVCGASACLLTCATDPDCIGTDYCSSGTCVAKKATGVACTAADQCLSGSCASGVCCGSACSGSCQTCAMPGHVGTCLSPAACNTTGCSAAALGGLVPASCFVDTDSDGLNDTWETNGYIDGDCNGINDCVPGPCVNDTPLPNADVNKPNIYVKWDYMTRTGAYTPSPTAVAQGCPGPWTTHSHQPSWNPAACTAAAINTCATTPSTCSSLTAMCQVIAAFARQNVILSYFPTQTPITETGEATYLAIGAPPACADTGAVSFYALKTANFPTYLAPAYHYAVFVHYNTCDQDGTGANQCGSCPTNPKTGLPPAFATTGLAEEPGNDFMVSFGNYVECGQPITDIMYAGTFMHELGHNLGLHHGGSTDGSFGGFTDGDTGFKPNYVSIMNYNYQLTGIGTGPLSFASGIVDPSTSYRIDYSAQALASLDEGGGAGTCTNDGTGGMSEATGVGGPAGDTDVVNFYTLGGSQLEYGAATGRIDWDADGDTGATGGDAAIYSDVNGDGLCNVLHGYNDWQHTTVGPVTTMQHLRTQSNCNTGNWADGVTPPLDQQSTNELTYPQAQALHLSYPFLSVPVTARPGCNTHFVVVNPNDHGKVPVAVYSAVGSNFDGTKVDTSTVRFAGAPVVASTTPDLNGDSIPDLLVTFDMSQLNLSAGATSAPLTGVLLPTKQLFGGNAAVTVVSQSGPIITNHNDGSGYAATLSPGLDHQILQFMLDACGSATDQCGASLNIDASTITKITSDEADHGAAGITEAAINGPGSFGLCHNRNGSGDGRVYTIYYNVVDQWNDVTPWTCQIQVPHDATGAAAINSCNMSPCPYCVGPGC